MSWRQAASADIDCSDKVKRIARRKRDPSDSTVPDPKGEVSAAASENGAAEEIERYLEPESSADRASRTSDPAAYRDPAPQIDFYREAQERLKECGINLRQFLFANPLAVEDLDDLEEAIIKATVG
jgi:hypothetical protein